MNQQSSSQSPVGIQSKSPQCYNCGAGDHFMMACPEQARQIPAGLAAARAAQAAQSSDAADSNQLGYGNRPFKRQKTGPIVTRFPAPPTGPVITHYAPPTTQTSPYAVNANSGYYGPPSSQPYQQQHLSHVQPYPPNVPPQQVTNYNPYVTPQMPNISQGYIQPTMPHSPQDYGQLTPQSMSQYGYQNFHGAPYQESHAAAPIPQQYGYTSVQYDQLPTGGQASPNYYSFQGQPPYNGNTTQNHPPYPEFSANRSFGPSIPAQSQNRMQNWSQPPAASQAYPIPAYQPEDIQYQKPYQNQYKKRPTHHPPHQVPPHFGRQVSSEPAPNSSPTTSLPQKAYNPVKSSQQFQKRPGRPRTFSAPNIHPQLAAQPPQSLVVDEVNEEAEFQWNLEKIFAEVVQNDADPIDRPLPTVYNEEPILPPAYNANAIIGKYVRPNNLDIFARDIRLSLHWPSLKTDPVFNEINFNSPLIPLDDIESWIQHRQSIFNLAESVPNSVQHLSVLEQASSEEQGTSSKSTYRGASSGSHRSKKHQAPYGGMDGASDSTRPPRDVTPAVNRSISPIFGRSGTPSLGADDDVWAPQPGEGQMMTSPVTDSTEALLASLGVTGSPKPVAPKNTILLSSPTYIDETSQDFYNRVPVRHDSGYVSQRGSISHENKNIADNSTSYNESRPCYNGTNPPPPPPPPPLHMRRHVDDALDSPSSDTSGQFRATASVSQNEAHNGSHQEGSPLTPTSAEGIAHEYSMPHERKFVRKAAPLRQVDDVTPKLKRRQPKVADAYSRRW